MPSSTPASPADQESNSTEATPNWDFALSRSPQRFFNREISDLDFIQRILEESDNPNQPLLERLRFLAISASVLDGFQTVRVAKLRRASERGETWLSPDGLTPGQQLAIISEKTSALAAQLRASRIQLRTLLARENVEVLVTSDLSAANKDWLKTWFRQHALHVLTPFSLDEEHPFPFMPSGGLCCIVEFESGYVLLPLPTILDRFVRLPSDGHHFVTLEAVISVCWDQLFPDKPVLSEGWFQILRDNDLAIEERSDDLRNMVESGLRFRHRANVNMLRVSADLPDAARLFIAEQLGILTDEEEIDANAGTYNINDNALIVEEHFLGIADLGRLISRHLGQDFPQFLFADHTPRTPQRLLDFDHDCFQAISHKDLLIHWPYETFDVVVAFLRQAARDENVLAIKQTLYRTNDDSPIVEALVLAASAGKAVTVVIELEARDNEQANIDLAKRLETAGAQIIYGIIGLKVHCKSTLVVRREDDNTRLYAHLGTGNYHPDNARTYTDLSFFTCDPDITADVSRVYHYLSSNHIVETNTLSVAPVNIRSRLEQLIDAEIEHARQGNPATIWAKLNSLTDPAMVDKLYGASQAGVEIDLVIRRQCILRPGIPGLSDNIRVKSVVGRFLEHSRIYCFGNGHSLPSDNALVYMSSADWMKRNLDERVEIMVPIYNVTIHKQILGQIMAANIRDQRQSWLLTSEGEYQRHQNRTGFCAQSYFMEFHSLSGLGSHRDRVSVPDPWKEI